MTLHEDNKCSVSFRCNDSKIDKCVLKMQSNKTFKGERSKTCKFLTGLICNSSVAKTNVMVLELKKMGVIAKLEGSKK